jgi:CBS domain-containing protein
MNVRLTAGELATRQTVVAYRHESLGDAARLMREHHVGCLVVVERAEAGDTAVGVLTDRDIAVAVVARDVDARMLRVGDVMSTDLVTAREDDSVLDVLATMRRRGVRRVPVVDAAGRLAGVLALDDILEVVAEQMLAVVQALRSGPLREAVARP